MTEISSKAFHRLVQGLKHKGKTCTVVESCCGGLINASIMAVPGSSSVFFGGSVAYNTRRSKSLLLNDSDLHNVLIKPIDPLPDESPAETYLRSKERWTAETALAFCDELGVDYAIAEGGAAGPTFRPDGLSSGFAVVAVAGRNQAGKVELLAQTTVRSDHNDRQRNMRLFADSAAKLAMDTIGITWKQSEQKDTSSSEATLLDRATHLRENERVMNEMKGRDDARHVILRNSSKECLFNGAELAYLTDLPQSIPKTFLGIHSSGAPWFQVDCEDLPTEFQLELPKDAYFDSTRTHGPLLHPNHRELALFATALSQWKRTHSFCSTCGATTIPIHGGTCMRCSNCGDMSWPRQDPSIIVLITNREGNKALLARSQRHPKKVHTALAGFVEAGESFEQAVIREAFEETSVTVDPGSIEYLSSQPWPFPRSCMVGFRATADDSIPIEVDRNELVSASWFDREAISLATRVRGPTLNKDVATAALVEYPDLQLLIPPKGVIARALIDNWLEDQPA